MEPRRATIVGAGIGGLATALALGRAGWQVQVVERGPALARSGAGLVLAPNAVHALRALGVAGAVEADATVIGETALRTSGGRTLSRVATTDVARRCGAPALGVVRSRLVETLADALVELSGPGSIRFGHPVDDPTGLDGLVVGADGIGSVVRRTWWPERLPRYAGYTAWRALLESPLLTGRPVATETWGRGERFGIVPVGRGRVYLYATAVLPPGAEVGDGAAELRRRFGGWHHPVPGLLDALEGATILRHDIHDLPAPATLHAAAAGRDSRHHRGIVLVGDAAHAMEPNLGQGAGTALEDAVELAHWLTTGPSTDAALARYSRSRLPRVAALAKSSRRIGRLSRVTHPALVAARDAALAVTPGRLGADAAVAVAGWRAPTARVAERSA